MSESRISGFTPVNGNVAGISNEDNRQDNQLCTGIYSGGFITINDSTTINISAGYGVVIDSWTDPEIATVYKIQWEAKTAVPVTYRTTNFTSYIGLARNAEVVQFATAPTPEERRDYIILGLVVHTSKAVLEAVSNQVQLGYDQANTLNDLSSAIGIINIDGNTFGANGANLRLTQSSGRSFKAGGNYYNSSKSPNVIESAGQAAPYLYKPYKDGAGNYSIVFPLTQTIDPTKWDNGTGTLATIPANTPWQVLRIYVNPVNDDVIVHYPQALYANIEAAESAIGGETFTPNPVLKDSMLRCFLIVKRDCTSLQDTTKCKFIAADKFGITKAQGALSNVPTLQSVYEATAADGDGDVPILVTGAFTLQDNNDSLTAVMLGIHDHAGNETFQLMANGTLAKARFLTGITASRPATPSAGQFYYDTTISKPIWYNGSDWKDATGATV